MVNGRAEGWNGLDFVNKQSHVAQLEGMNIYRWVKLPEA